MQVEVFKDPRKFARQAVPVFDRAPEACNVIATQAARAAAAGARGDDVYVLVRDGSTPIGWRCTRPRSTWWSGRPAAPIRWRSWTG